MRLQPFSIVSSFLCITGTRLIVRNLQREVISVPPGSAHRSKSTLKRIIEQRNDNRQRCLSKNRSRQMRIGRTIQSRALIAIFVLRGGGQNMPRKAKKGRITRKSNTGKSNCKDGETHTEREGRREKAG